MNGACTGQRAWFWDADLLTQFDPLLVWASPIVSNNKYEGDIRKQGDVVHVNSLLRPSIGDYKLPDGMTAQRPDSVDQKLPITEAKYLQVLIEDAERIQLASGNLNSPINQQMIRSLAREADTFMGDTVAKGATALPIERAVPGGLHRHRPLVRRQDRALPGTGDEEGRQHVRRVQADQGNRQGRGGMGHCGLTLSQ